MHRLGAIIAVVAMLLLLIAAPAQAWGGGGTVTMFGVGPLKFDHSTPDDLAHFAGDPDTIVYWDQYGMPTNASNAEWAIAKYHYLGHHLYTWYSFWWDGADWVLEQFDTTLKRFHTDRGTRVGMTYAQAKHRENRPWSGGCIDVGLHRYRRVGGDIYELLVGVDRGKHVHALHAMGPHQLLC
jgi:hypothetical protein